MANNYLLTIYKELFNEDFSYSVFENRLKMQKAIYLLQELGVHIGEYSFSWYKHGPYSQSLLDDMHEANNSNKKSINYLSSDARISIGKLKSALKLPEGSSYNEEEWVECLGSLHYLSKNIPMQLLNEKTILNMLLIKKPHLNNEKTNEIAFSKIKNLFF